MFLNWNIFINFSYLAMMGMWPKNCATIAKSSLLYTGSFGIAAWLCGTIFINRMNSQQSRKAMDDTVKTIRGEHVSIQ